VPSPAQLLLTEKRLIGLLNLYDQADLVSIPTAPSLHIPSIHTARITQFTAHVHTHESRTTIYLVKIAIFLVRCVGQIRKFTAFEDFSCFSIQTGRICMAKDSCTCPHCLSLPPLPPLVSELAMTQVCLSLAPTDDNSTLWAEDSFVQLCYGNPYN
jgi:hypothetical protein